MPPPPTAGSAPIARSGRWQASPIGNSPVAVESYIAGKLRGAGSSSTGGLASSSSPFAGFEMTATMVGHLFSLHPKRLSLDRCRFADGAFEALAQEVGRSTTLTGLSISSATNTTTSNLGGGGGSIGTEQLHLLWNALLENTTLEALDISSLQLVENDASFLADNVIPWNRSIVEWNVSNNPDLGDKGSQRIVAALVSAASSVERINLRRCGMGAEGLVSVLLEVRSLTSLQQLDIALNGGYHQPHVMDVMREVDEILHRNCKLMHPSDTMSHTALYDAAAVEMRDGGSLMSADAAFGDFSASGFGDSSSASPTAQSGISSMKRRDSLRRDQQPPSLATKQLERRASLLLRSPDKQSLNVNAAPSPMRAASFRGGRGTAGNTTAAVAAQLPLDAPSQTQRAAAAAVSRGDVSNVVDVSAIESNHGADAPGSSSFLAAAAARTHADPADLSSGGGVVRRSSLPFAATPQQQHDSSSRTPRRTASPRQQHSSFGQGSPLIRADVNDGAEDWKRVKEHYNNYIRSGASPASGAGSTSSPARASSSLRKAALDTPKYVLGKLVSKVKSGHPSSSFHPTTHGTVMYVREPLPAERRMYAPWNQSNATASHVFDSPSRRSGTPNRPSGGGGDTTTANTAATTPGAGAGLIPPSYVGKRVVVVDPKSDPRHQTAIRIIDGGDVTMIQDDPRDIGYASRKMQAGAAVSKPSAGFASNTQREVRWGTDVSNQIARTAQAPPPGTYTVLSPFDASVKKAQAAARATTATGKKCFGSSGSARGTNVARESDAPGPGFYEIP